MGFFNIVVAPKPIGVAEKPMVVAKKAKKPQRQKHAYSSPATYRPLNNRPLLNEQFLSKVYRKGTDRDKITHFSELKKQKEKNLGLNFRV
jgi:hypothetical protein